MVDLHTGIFIAALLLQFEQTAQLAKGLQRYGGTAARARAVAVAVQHHATKSKLDPRLVAAVVTIENPKLTPRTRNGHSGATGIMQVMPGWLRIRPDWRRECGSNLKNVNTNICWGTKVLRYHLDEHPKSLRKGLLAFNGCRSRTICQGYPALVLKRTQQLSSKTFATATP